MGYSGKGFNDMKSEYLRLARRADFTEKIGRIPSAEMNRRGKIPEKKKTRQPAASSATIPTCENSGVTRPGNETGSPWWEASRLTAQPQQNKIQIFITQDVRVDVKGISGLTTTRTSPRGLTDPTTAWRKMFASPADHRPNFDRDAVNPSAISFVCAWQQPRSLGPNTAILNELSPVRRSCCTTHIVNHTLADELDRLLSASSAPGNSRAVSGRTPPF
ncbi:hypothetical protein PR048_031630 [Dryococelus australis]|uniref:Uncharacterized protein n=1 Tax=Dryococelus australis TaxID=614101 RepID=A0ABQ9G5U0_9NEOP|nr:hypothetical protein PR048_031630 [Dryococelus australis]